MYGLNPSDAKISSLSPGNLKWSCRQSILPCVNICSYKDHCYFNIIGWGKEDFGNQLEKEGTNDTPSVCVF